AFITNVFCFADNCIDQRAPQPLATELVAHKQTLHLADAVVDFSQRYAARRFVVIVSQQQPAIRSRVVTGQISKFFLEVLEAKIDLEPCGVLFEELARLFDFLGRLSLNQLHVDDVCPKAPSVSEGASLDWSATVPVAV